MSTGEKQIPVYYKTKNRGMFRFDPKEKIDDNFTNCGMFTIYADETISVLQGRLYKCKHVIRKKLKLKNYNDFNELNATLLDENHNVIYTTGCHPMKDGKIGVPRSLVYGPENTSEDIIYSFSGWEFIGPNTLCKDLYVYDNVVKMVVW